MTTYEVDENAFGCRIVRLEGAAGPGDRIVADFGGDGRACAHGVSNDAVFEVVVILKDVPGLAYDLPGVTYVLVVPV